MTIIVGYKASDAAKAALDFGLELGAKLAMRVIVVNAGPGSEHRSESQLTQAQAEQLEQYLADFELTTKSRKYARGRSTYEELYDLVALLDKYLNECGGS